MRKLLVLAMLLFAFNAFGQMPCKKPCNLEGVGGGTITSGITVQGESTITAGSSDDSALNLNNSNTSANEYGQKITLDGAATNNYGLYISTTGGTNDYAIHTANGLMKVSDGLEVDGYTFDMAACTNNGYVLTTDGTDTFTCVAGASGGTGDITDVFGCATGNCNQVAVEATDWLRFDDDVELKMGTDSDWIIKYNTGSSALTFTSTNNAANTNISFTNSDGTYLSDLSVDGSVTAKTFSTSAVDGKRYISVSNTITPTYSSPANGHRQFNTSTTPDAWAEYDGTAWVPDGVIGEIYSDDTTGFSETVGVAGTFVAVNDAEITSGKLVGATHATAGQLVLTYAGTYLINYSANIYTDTAQVEIVTSVGISGITENTNCTTSNMVYTATNDRINSGTCILNITAGQYIQLLVTSKTGTPVVTFMHMNLNAYRISR